MRLQLNHSSGLIRAAHMMSCLFAPLLNLKNNRSSKNALLSFVIQRLHGCSEEMDSIRGSYGTVNQANIKEYISMLIAKAVKAKGNMALSVLFLFSDFVLNLSCNVLYCIVLYCIIRKINQSPERTGQKSRGGLSGPRVLITTHYRKASHYHLRYQMQ
jgi:hypothetical protein